MPKKINPIILKFFILPIICLLSVIFAWPLINAGRTLPALSVGSLAVGGIKTNLAEKVLTERLKEFATEKITFAYQNKSWQFTPQELGLQINLAPTLEQINSLGHNANLLTASGEWLAALFKQTDLPLEYSFDLSKLNQAMSDLAAIENASRIRAISTSLLITRNCS